MLNYLMGVWLTTAVTLAQTTPQAAQKPASAKPSAQATASAKAGPATAPAKPASATAPARPLPEHPLSTKLRNNNTTNPNYNREKARGRGTKREYTPRRTETGERKDTMNQRRPGSE